MTLTFLKVISRITYVLFAFVVYLSFTDVKADTALIYHSNYYDSHTNVKAQLEADGYTVTLSTTGSVHENLFTNNIDGTSGGYDVVYDMKYNNNIGSNGKTRYQNFVQAGGVLVLVGENQVSYSNTNNTMVAFIENKLGGTVSINGNTTGCAFNCTNNTNSNTITTTNTAITDSDYGSNVAVYPYGAHFTGDGTWLAKDGNGRILWMRWSGDQLPSGYTGAAYITFDINQFQSEFDKTNMANMISDTYTSVLSTVSYSSAPTTTQTNLRTTTRGITTDKNSIYITQSGNNLDLDITQYDDNQLIAGLGTTSSSIDSANISGNNNTISITQGNNSGSFSDGNTVLFDVNGDSNNLTIRQGDNIDDDGDHDLRLNVVGNTNTGSFTQEEDGAVGNAGHFMDVDIAGNSNSIDIDQNDDGDKMLFLDINGDSNTIDLDQRGTGNHFLDVTVANNQTVTVDQNGSGDHAATINMSGNASGLDLTQNSSSDQTYSLTQICNTGGGCGTTTFTQN